jgi:hypothetical protein
MASADTAVDERPQHTAVRAASAGWLTPGYAHAQMRASIRSAPGAEWDTWVRHRAYLVVKAELSGDDHPPDTPATAARGVLLDALPVGRDGWCGANTTSVVAVVLRKIHGVWRINSDQTS